MTKEASAKSDSSVVVRMRADDCALLLFLQALLVHVALQALVDGLHAALQELVLYVAHDHVVARARGRLRDAVAHRARADNSDYLCHV